MSFKVQMTGQTWEEDICYGWYGLGLCGVEMMRSIWRWECERVV